jgi:3-deoxy-D-manno-octulosonic-acid transferase
MRHWRWRRGMASALLHRFTRILAQDPDSAARLHALGAPPDRLDMAGRIEETTEPLPCTEAERAALAALLQARPVWLAMACPPAELEAVIAAHAQAMQLAHRMLLILVPADPDEAAAMAERCGREGWIIAERTREQEPEPEVQALIADGLGELGLWYRLAPVSFMGGTLLAGDGAAPRHPFEPAALGSAIIHGLLTETHSAEWTQLDGANAARMVTDAAGLARAVADLTAADQAAILAGNAWAVSTGGAAVLRRIADTVINAMENSA